MGAVSWVVRDKQQARSALGSLCMRLVSLRIPGLLLFAMVQQGPSSGCSLSMQPIAVQAFKAACWCRATSQQHVFVAAYFTGAASWTVS